MVRAFLTPNDPLYSNQYGLVNMAAPQAWDRSTGSSSIVVAVLDTGIDSDHPDLQARIDPRGYNFVGNPGEESSSPEDDHGHGTAVSGVIGAVTSNETGVAGVDWKAKILPIKVLNSQGEGPIEDIVQGIEYAIAQDVDVMNMSFGQSEPNSSLQTACEDAASGGIVSVVAAGNYNSSSKTYPAGYSSVLSVAAVDDEDKRSVWGSGSASNYGDWVGVSAPGTEIWSTRKNGSYGGTDNLGNGTSLACPFVSGLAGLVKALYPSITTAQEIMDRIKNTADDIDAKNPGYEGKLGTGRINAYRALAGIFAQITTPEAGAYVKGTVNIYGSASGWDFSNYVLEALQNNTLITTIETSTTSAESALLGAWNTSAYNGEYKIKLKVYSTSASTDEAEVTIFVNNTTPEANISSPADGATIEGRVIISGTAKDPYFDRYDLEYGAGASPLSFEKIENQPGKESYYASVEAGALGTWETAGLNGAYTLKLTSYNKAGAYSTASILLNISNTVAPTKEVEPQAGMAKTYALPNPFNRSSVSEITFNYDLTGNFDTKIYLFDIAGNLIWQKSYLAGTNGGKSGVNNPSWNGVDLYGSQVPNGVYLYQVVADRKILARGKAIVL
jgi:thermitase